MLSARLHKMTELEQSQRNTKARYRFSTYRGDKFFDAFFSGRKKSMTMLKRLLLNRKTLTAKAWNEFYYLDCSYNEREFSVDEIKHNVLVHAIDFDNSFSTHSMLLLLLQLISDQYNVMNTKQMDFLRALAKKFNVVGRISKSYTANFQKKTTEYADIEIYALLSLVSIKLFEKNGLFNWLDLVLKLNDFIQEHKYEQMTAFQQLSCYIALKKELIIAERIVKSIDENT